jgi:hypothetical protein
VDYRKEAEDVQEQNKQMRVITWVGLGLNILLGTGKAIAGTVSAAPSRVRARAGRVIALISLPCVVRTCVCVCVGVVDG